jgi:dienelactone hydrolase
MNRAVAATALAVLSLSLLIGAPARAAVKTETVTYKQGDTTLKGFLAYDDATSEKRPGVLVAPEWYGLNEYARGRAKQLAELGYVAFVMDPYGDGKNAADPKEAAAMSGALKADRKLLRARANAGLEQLKKSPNVDPQRLAGIGYCFGGTTVLELARSGADVDGVVSFHGSLGSPTPEDAKNIKGKVLVLHGADDPFVSDEEVVGFREEMRKAKVDWQIHAYGGAVHSFTNPGADKAGMKGVAYHKAADQRSWEAMKDLFNEVFGATTAK